MKISYNELIHSDIAEKKGIKNEPNDVEKNNVNKLMKFLNDHIAPLVPEPVSVNSGFRNHTINQLAGGVTSSHHRVGLAADLRCSNMARLLAALFIKIDKIDQLIYYPNRGFVHVSIHPRMLNKFYIKE